MCQALTATAEDKAFKRRCQLIACASLVLYLASSQLSLRMHGSLAGTLVAALAGAAFFTEVAALTFLTIRIRDEFQRILLTRSFLWATALTMALATIWGFVELHTHDTMHIPVLWVPAALILFTTFAKVLIFRQHRSPHD